MTTGKTIAWTRRTLIGKRPAHSVQAAARAGALSVAEQSYPTSEVRGSCRECQATTAQEWRRGASPRPRSGATVWRSHPVSEARGGGREDQDCIVQIKEKTHTSKKRTQSLDVDLQKYSQLIFDKGVKIIQWK